MAKNPVSGKGFQGRSIWASMEFERRPTLVAMVTKI